MEKKFQGILLLLFKSQHDLLLKRNLKFILLVLDHLTMTSINRTIHIGPLKRGFHLITPDVYEKLPEISSIKTGILSVFMKHTSASLSINENADPTVLNDFENFFNEFVPENSMYFKHTLEGPDDMPAHIKSSILGNHLQIPITNGQLNLGTWQGLYLCEHRNSSTARELVVTLLGLE